MGKPEHVWVITSHCLLCNVITDTCLRQSFWLIHQFIMYMYYGLWLQYWPDGIINVKKKLSCFTEFVHRMISDLRCPSFLLIIWGLRCQKQLSRAWISDYIPHNTGVCDYLSFALKFLFIHNLSICQRNVEFAISNSFWILIPLYISN